MIRIPLAEVPGECSPAFDERLLLDRSYGKWIVAKAPRLPLEPPLELPEAADEFLRRIRADRQ